MKIMPTDLKELGIVDEIIAEPDGGAHSDHDAAAKIFGDTLERQLLILSNQGIKELLHARYQKFRHMCQFFDLGGQTRQKGNSCISPPRGLFFCGSPRPLYIPPFLPAPRVSLSLISEPAPLPCPLPML